MGVLRILGWKNLGKICRCQTLSVKGQNSHVTKASKDRVTVMFPHGASGEKLKPLMTRCFENIKMEIIGVNYTANKKACLKIFNNYDNKEMPRQGWKELLFLDNSSSYEPDIEPRMLHWSFYNFDFLSSTLLSENHLHLQKLNRKNLLISMFSVTGRAKFV